MLVRKIKVLKKIMCKNLKKMRFCDWSKKVIAAL